MIDYYLQTADEPTMRAALIEAGVTDDEGNPTEGATVDVIGTWSERTGGTDEDPVMTVVPGWHFNVRSGAPIEWPENVVRAAPVSPWRVWG